MEWTPEPSAQSSAPPEEAPPVPPPAPIHVPEPLGNVEPLPEPEAVPRPFNPVPPFYPDYPVDLFLVRKEKDEAFYRFCSSLPRWYDLTWDIFPIATCYRERDEHGRELGHINFRDRTICFIERFVQDGGVTFLSLQEEVATIQAHESRGWLFIDEAVYQRQEIMAQYTKCLRAIRLKTNMGLGPEFWGSIFFDVPLY